MISNRHQIDVYFLVQSIKRIFNNPNNIIVKMNKYSANVK